MKRAPGRHMMRRSMRLNRSIPQRALKAQATRPQPVFQSAITLPSREHVQTPPVPDTFRKSAHPDVECWPPLKQEVMWFDPECLSNFEDAKQTFGPMIAETNNAEYKSVYTTPREDVMNLFAQVFPRLQESRGIGEITKEEDFKRWNSNEGNDVEIETLRSTSPCWDSMPDSTFTEESIAQVVATNTTGNQNKDEILRLVHQAEEYDRLSVGGPSALIANHWSHVEESTATGNTADKKVGHFVTSRKDSNHDGSAYYYHERDAFPVYINKVNRGPFCVYIDLWKRLKVKNLWKIIQGDHETGYVRISMNWGAVFRSPNLYLPLFFRNFCKMMKNIYLGGKDLHYVVTHAQRTPGVVDKIAQYYGGMRSQLLSLHDPRHKACYINLNSKYDASGHFNWLNKQFAKLPFQQLPKEEITSTGFGDNVKEILHFPNDGLINPYFLDQLQQWFTYGDNSPQGDLRHSMQLKKIWLAPSGEYNYVQFQNSATGGDVFVKTKELVLSLGPSAQYQFVDSEKNKKYHNNHRGLGGVASRLTQNNPNALEDVMWAAGTSSVLLVCVDRSKLKSEEEMYRFSYYIDAINQHWTVIDSNTVTNGEDGKQYSFFAIQMTGGGHFPSNNVKPDMICSAIYNCERVYNLVEDRSAITYDIIQLRGCGRGVTASNSICFAKFNKASVAFSYGLGGIGMTTMFPNGVLLHDLLNNKFESDNTCLQGINYESMVKHIDCP